MRASLSRALRRLWHAGLVELLDTWGHTLTAETHANAAAKARNPEDVYRRHLEFLATLGELVGHPVPDKHGSADAYAGRPQHQAHGAFHAETVTLTPAGDEAVKSPAANEQEPT